MVIALEAHFARAGADERSARGEAEAVVAVLAERFGGRMVYLPRGAKLKQELRDREIYRRSKRESADKLAGCYGLSQARVYSIIKQQRGRVS